MGLARWIAFQRRSTVLLRWEHSKAKLLIKGHGYAMQYDRRSQWRTLATVTH